MDRRSDIARAAGADAANRQMRAEGRTAWSRADYNLAAKEYGRIIDSLTSAAVLKGTYFTKRSR